MTPTEPLRPVEQIAHAIVNGDQDVSECAREHTSLCRDVTAALRREREETERLRCEVQYAARLLEQGIEHADRFKAEIDRLRALVGEALELVHGNQQALDARAADIRRRAGLDSK